MTAEERTARLTVLVDPRKKAEFERLCAEADTTPSQVIRAMIRHYIQERTGRPWAPAPEPARPPRRSAARRSEKVQRT